MDQLALHIEYLLRQNDCVILPGIGAFINAYTPAQFDEDSFTWHPMTKEVRFNQAVNQDDGLLANSYSRKYCIPFHDARNLLEADIKHLMSLIKEDGEVTIGRLGTLSMTDGYTLLFSPLQSSDCYNKESGRISIMIKQSHPDTTDKSHLLRKESESSVNAESTSHATEGNVHSIAKDYHFNTDRNYYIPINKIFAKISASLIVILMLALFVLIRTDERPGEDQASVLPVKEIVDTTASLTGFNTPHDSHKSNRDDNYRAIDEEYLSKKENNQHKYHLIIGTFKSEKEASRYINNLENSYNNISIVPSATLYRVSIASSDVKEELINTLNSPEISRNFEGAWIWENKTIK